VHSSRAYSRSRRAALVAGAAALVGCAALGATAVAGAQSAPPDDQPALTYAPADQVGGGQVAVGAAQAGKPLDPGQLQQQQDKFIGTLASKLGVSTDKLKQALSDTQQEVGPVPLVLGKPATAVTLSDPLKAAASALNISEDQLKQEHVGKSLTDVAKAHNVDPQTVANALKAQRTADLDQAVKDGKLTADMASRMRTNLDAEIQFMMSIVPPAKMVGPGGAGPLFIATAGAAGP
jgi:plasmid maintenance system antidote protein VapI